MQPGWGDRVIYRLFRGGERNPILEVDARDRGHAVDIFSQRLGRRLSLNAGPGDPRAPYLMEEFDSRGGATWRKPPDIPVYER